MKLRNAYKWITFKIEGRKRVIMDAYLNGDPSLEDEADRATFEALKASLTKEPRYILYDLSTHAPDGRTIRKTFFLFW